MRWRSVLKWGLGIVLAVPVVLTGLVAVFVLVLALSGPNEAPSIRAETPPRNWPYNHATLRTITWRAEVANEWGQAVARQWALRHSFHVAVVDRSTPGVPGRLILWSLPVVIESWAPTPVDYIRRGGYLLPPGEMVFDVAWHGDEADHERLDAVVASLAEALSTLGQATVTAAPRDQAPRTPGIEARINLWELLGIR